MTLFKCFVLVLTMMLERGAVVPGVDSSSVAYDDN